MGQVSRKLKKYIFGIVLGIALMCGTKSYAQYNREYFFWVGRSCMMNNDYQEAIRTLNTLLRFEDRKSTRLNSSHIQKSRMPSSA